MSEPCSPSVLATRESTQNDYPRLGQHLLWPRPVWKRPRLFRGCLVPSSPARLGSSRKHRGRFPLGSRSPAARGAGTADPGLILRALCWEP